MPAPAVALMPAAGDRVDLLASYPPGEGPPTATTVASAVLVLAGDGEAVVVAVPAEDVASVTRALRWGAVDLVLSP